MGGIVSSENKDTSEKKSEKHSEVPLEEVINQYAADLILRSTFRDMQRLTEKDEEKPINYENVENSCYW